MPQIYTATINPAAKRLLEQSDAHRATVASRFSNLRQFPPSRNAGRYDGLWIQGFPMHKLTTSIALTAFVLVAVSLVAAQTDTSSPPDLQLDELYSQRDDALQELVRIEKAKYEQGIGSHLAVNSAERMLLEAKLESVRVQQERIAILKSLLQLAERREQMTANDVKTAIADPPKLIEAKVDRLNAQIALQREERK